MLKASTQLKHCMCGDTVSYLNARKLLLTRSQSWLLWGRFLWRSGLFYTKFQCNLNTYHSTETWNTNAVTLKDSSTPLYEDVMRWGTGYLFFMLLSSPIVTSLLNLSQVKFMNPWFWYKRRAWRFNLWELQTQFWKPCQVSGHTLWHNSKQIIWETLYTVFLKWLILKLYPCHPSKFIHVYSF